MDLTKIRGIGDKLAKKITESFGSEEELFQAIHNFEVDRIAQIDGISQSMAINIINSVLGNYPQEFLKTERALKIYDDIIQKILGYSHTKYAKNRVLLISPTKDKQKIQKNINFVMKAKKIVSELPIEDLSNLLKKIKPITKNRPEYDPAKALLVESKEDYKMLIEMNLNKYCQIITPEELESLKDFEFIVYVYSEGMIDLGGAPNAVMVRNDSKEFEIVPEVVLSYFYANYDLLYNILKIKDILGRKSVLPEVIDILNSLESDTIDEKIFDDALEAVKADADEKLKDKIKELNLKGDEVLEILSESMPDKIRIIFDEIIKEAKEEIREKTGHSFDPFIRKYPIKIDYDELERVKKSAIAKKHVEIFDKKVKAASRLSKLKTDVEEEIREILEFDYEFALGCFAYYYDLNPPDIGDGFYFEDAIHLDLALKSEESIQKVNYVLEAPQNVTLLTGANSGGKTTLLETLAQISIMAQMGLPVCAKKAVVEIMDEIYFFSQKRTLDAGAFESFLGTFIPIVTEKTSKLVLLDELEAITELEAASKIISSFIDFIRNSNSYAVIVTHMAEEITKYTNARVDGIDAVGLDDDYNLIVDRTPKINHLAKSTPELILRMLYNRSDGELKEIYRQILDKF